MITTIPSKPQIENTQDKFSGSPKWQLEDGIEEWIKKDLGVEE